MMLGTVLQQHSLLMVLSSSMREHDLSLCMLFILHKVKHLSIQLQQGLNHHFILRLLSTEEHFEIVDIAFRQVLDQ